MIRKFVCGCQVDVDGDGDAPLFEMLCDKHREMELQQRRALYEEIIRLNEEPLWKRT